jgi:hypothetical protein
MRATTMLLAAAFAVSGCDGTQAASEVSNDAVTADALDDTATQHDAVDAQPDPGPAGPCGPLGERQISAVQLLQFARVSATGTANGLDLDGHQTKAGDPEGCGREDYVDDQGRPGVDNQFASLAGILDELGGSSLDESIATAVRTGELLLLFDLQSLDDPHHDACVSLDIYRGEGTPTLGTDGLLVPGQSLDVALDKPWSRIDTATVQAGTLRAGPFPLHLPLTFFDTKFTLEFESAWVQASLDAESGTLRGVLAAQADVEDLQRAILQIDPGLVLTAQALLEDAADLSPDSQGTCRAISIVFEFTAVRAHLYPDATRHEAGTQL